MTYRILFIPVFLTLTSHLWSQETLHSELEKKLAADIHEVLLRTNEEKSKTEAGNNQESLAWINKDPAYEYYIIRTCIVKKAQTFIGVSYRYGQSSEKGFDCSGFVKYIFRDFGLELPHSSYTQYKISKHIEKAEARPGDLVFFVTRGNGASHVGIYLGNNQFIHSPGTGRTVSIDSLDAYYYKKHLFGFGSVL
jgi:hypothetical protein